MLVKDACTGFDAIMDPNGEIETANNAQGGRHVDLNGGGSGRRLFLVPIKDPTDTWKVVAVGLSGKNSLAMESYFNQISNTLTFSSTGSYLVSKTTAVENL